MFVSIVSDGAGSAVFGGQGASLICRSIGQSAKRHFSAQQFLPSDPILEDWVDDARDLIVAVAQRRRMVPRDFAATLVCVISNGDETVVAHVGDGCAVVKSADHNGWIALTWPDHGEFASTTRFVTDEPPPALRITRHHNPIAALVAFTDGLERLALDFAGRQPFAGFFDGVCNPLLRSHAVGRDVALQAHLRSFLASGAVNGRTDDDKTLVLAVRT